MYAILLSSAVLLSLVIIGLVLLQHGKGADTGAAFGGGASGSVFGSRGSATFLSRTTAVIVALFFVNCLALAWVVKTTPPEQSAITGIPDTRPEAETPSEPTLDERPAYVPEDEAVEGETAADESPADQDPLSDIPE